MSECVPSVSHREPQTNLNVFVKAAPSLHLQATRNSSSIKSNRKVDDGSTYMTVQDVYDNSFRAFCMQCKCKTVQPLVL